jgi:hypothetical protein
MSAAWSSNTPLWLMEITRADRSFLIIEKDEETWLNPDITEPE